MHLLFLQFMIPGCKLSIQKQNMMETVAGISHVPMKLSCELKIAA